MSACGSVSIEYKLANCDTVYKYSCSKDIMRINEGNVTHLVDLVIRKKMLTDNFSLNKWQFMFLFNMPSYLALDSKLSVTGVRTKEIGS
jgi:hypothetical protein